ncbi:MAG: DUF1552 domain-containing protein [Deltaproteobacteria bacterium]|nr:DUF1552 domain-containing protein [Deltaproteobacteria bacterium]
MPMKSVSKQRRAFLRAVGASPFALPAAATFMRALPAWAAQEKRYLILLFTPNGVVRHLWGADVAGNDFTLRPWLAPLNAYKDKMNIVTGLQNKVASSVGGTHEGGMSTLWSGGRQGATPMSPAGETIDQTVAKHLMSQGAGTKYASLEFRARAPEDFQGKTIENRMIYSGPGAPVDPREDPIAARDQLFLGIGKGGGGSMPTVDPVQARKLLVRKRVLQHLSGELQRLSPKLCTEDKRHLDALRDGWSTLEGRLNDNNTPASADCAYPDNITGTKAFPKATRDAIELLAMSLACDLTRVASLQMSQARSPMVADWLGHSKDHHSISHEAPQPFTLGPQAPQATDAERPTQQQLDQFKVPIAQMTDINVFYAEEVAYLCKRLSQFPVDGGKTLLDQCVIAWGNELDNGSNHDHFNMPFVLIGSAGGKLKTKQVVQFPVLNSYMAQAVAMRQHNDLLVTLAKAFGAPVEKFGDPTYSKGPITELLV